MGLPSFLLVALCDHVGYGLSENLSGKVASFFAFFQFFLYTIVSLPRSARARGSHKPGVFYLNGPLSLRERGSRGEGNE
jgi:hypothetical protein